MNSEILGRGKLTSGMEHHCAPHPPIYSSWVTISWVILRIPCYEARLPRSITHEKLEHHSPPLKGIQRERVWCNDQRGLTYLWCTVSAVGPSSSVGGSSTEWRHQTSQRDYRTNTRLGCGQRSWAEVIYMYICVDTCYIIKAWKTHLSLLFCDLHYTCTHVHACEIHVSRGLKTCVLVIVGVTSAYHACEHIMIECSVLWKGFFFLSFLPSQMYS